MLRSSHATILRRTTTKGTLIRLLEIPNCHRSPGVPPRQVLAGSRCVHTPVLFARKKTATAPTEASTEDDRPAEASTPLASSSKSTQDANTGPAESAESAESAASPKKVNPKKKRSQKAVRREKTEAKALAKRKQRKDAKSKTKAQPKRRTKAPAKPKHALVSPEEARRRVGMVLEDIRSNTRNDPSPNRELAPSDQEILSLGPPRDSTGLLSRWWSWVNGAAAFIKGRPPSAPVTDDNEKVVEPLAALQDQAPRDVLPPPPKTHIPSPIPPSSKSLSTAGNSRLRGGGAGSSIRNQTKAEPSAVPSTTPNPSPVLPPLPIAKIKSPWKCYPDTTEARRKRLEQAKTWPQWFENSLTLAPEKLPSLPVLTDKASERVLFKSESPLRIQMLAWEGDIIVAYAAGRAAVRRNIPLGLRGTAKSLLVGNISLSYLGLAYDLKRPPFHDPDNGPAQKAFADHFEAYIGAFHRQAVADRRLDDFTGFMDKLFSEEVFPAVAANTEAYLKKGKKARAKLSPQTGHVTGLPVNNVDPSSGSPSAISLEASLQGSSIDTRTDEQENVVIARTDRLGPLFASTGWKGE